MRIEGPLGSYRSADDGRALRAARRLENVYSSTELGRVLGQLASAVDRLGRTEPSETADAQRRQSDGRALAPAEPEPRAPVEAPLSYRPPGDDEPKDQRQDDGSQGRRPREDEAAGAHSVHAAAPRPRSGSRLDARIRAYTRPVPGPVGSQFSTRA